MRKDDDDGDDDGSNDDGGGDDGLGAISPCTRELPMDRLVCSGRVEL